ncbi:MAG: hypothetical protein GY937_20010 [bacterium]|nr:hypothetical protein [bacterium]
MQWNVTLKVRGQATVIAEADVRELDNWVTWKWTSSVAGWGTTLDGQGLKTRATCVLLQGDLVGTHSPREEESIKVGVFYMDGLQGFSAGSGEEEVSLEWAGVIDTPPVDLDLYYEEVSE